MLKKCSRCGDDKDTSEFGKCKTFSDGLYCQCNICRRKSSKESYLRNREKIRAKANGNPIILARMRKAGAAYRKSERYTEKRVGRYGLSLEEYKARLEQQEYRCLICLRPFGEDTPHVDHNHDTGEVRGLLCISCNRAIGLLGDNVEIIRRAASYLNRKNDNDGKEV